MACPDFWNEAGRQGRPLWNALFFIDFTIFLTFKNKFRLLQEQT